MQRLGGRLYDLFWELMTYYDANIDIKVGSQSCRCRGKNGPDHKGPCKARSMSLDFILRISGKSSLRSVPQKDYSD